MKNKFGFILIKPQLGENIGACARSIKNFGFTKLNDSFSKAYTFNNLSKNLFNLLCFLYFLGNMIIISIQNIIKLYLFLHKYKLL